MKTSHFSIIVTSVFVISLAFTTDAFAQNSTTYSSSNDLGAGNVFSMTAKDLFLPGDLVEVNGSLITTTPIIITLDDPHGEMVTSKTTFSDREGYFTSELKVPANAEAGIWKIVGTSGIYHKELNFTITGNSDTVTTCYAGNLCSTFVANTTVQYGPKLVTQTAINSPLKQFKSGIAANDIICRPDMQLLIQNQENFPICVKLDSVSNLLRQDWSYPTNCEYVHGPFAAGVSGLIIIENNASNQFSGKSYFPKNSTVVIGWNNTVSWINQDVTPSSVISDWNLFDSGPILPGADWQHDFECAGNYGYHSEPHPWMKGWIRVLPPSR